MWVFYASRAVISVLKNGECQAVSPDSRRGETQFPNTNRGENWVWSPANLTEIIIKKQNRNSAFKDRIIWARTFLNLPQDVGGIASSFFVRQPVTKLSPRRANTVIAPSLLSPSPSLPHSLSRSVFSNNVTPENPCTFFFSPPPNFHGFLSLCPVFWILNHRLFSSGVINISIMSIITHNYIHHLRHRRDHRDHHSSRINTSLSSALCAGVSCAQEFFQYNCTHNLRCFFVIRVQ